MKIKRSLKTTPQLKVKLKLQYGVAAAVVLAVAVGVGFVVYLNFGNNTTARAGITAAGAGITSYDFSWGTNGSLSAMNSGATTLIGSNQTNVSSDVESIGFNFTFMGKVYNTFSVNTNGVLRFGDDPILSSANTYGIPGNDRIAIFAISAAAELRYFWGYPYWAAIDANLKTHTNGRVRYKVFGTAPNRYMVVEWKNMQIPAGSNTNDGTFQLKLHESDAASGALSGAIEMTFGGMKVGNDRMVSYRIGFGIGPESGNFYSLNTSNGSLSETNNYNNENNTGTLTPLVGNRRYGRFVSSRRPEGHFGNFSLTCPSPNSVSVKFDENSEDEAGISVYRKKLGDTDDKFKFVKSLIPDARVLSDGGIEVGQSYVYRFYLLGESQYSIDYTDYTTDPIPASSAHQTVLSGDWTNPDIWGGVLPGDYEDVVIGCSGTVFITANVNAKITNLTIEKGSFFTIPDGQTLEIRGDFVNNGVFNPVGTGKLLLTGGNDQVIENNGLGKTNDTKFVSDSPDNSWGDNTTGIVASKTITVDDSDFIAIKEVVVDISHTYLRDLTVYLVTPDGTPFKLAENRGQRGENYTDVSFNPLGQPLPPSIQNIDLTGSYRPEESFSTYIGPLDGVWTLRVDDLMTGVGGTLNKFELILTKGGSNDLVLKNIDVNKSGGGITLNSGLFVEGNLTLESGVIYSTTENFITFESGASSSAGNLISFISGPVSKKGSQDFVFPIGKGGKWAPLSISNMSNGSSETIFRAEYFNGPKAGDNTLEESDLKSVSGNEYWDLTPVEGTPTVDVTLHWKNNTGEYIKENTLTDLVVAHYTGGVWVTEGGNLNPASEGEVGGQGSITITDIDSFSPFTFGSTNSETILPVELVSFKGESRGDGNLLSWKTASERNNSHFEIEKSIDGKNYKKIGQVKGSGDSYIPVVYNFTDLHLTSPIAYYRLKQVDFNGEHEYSKIIFIGNEWYTNEIQLYPNPAERSLQFVMVNLSGLGLNQANIIIRDANGQIISKISLSQSIELEKEPLDISHLKAGIYLVEINSIREKVIKRLIVR